MRINSAGSIRTGRKLYSRFGSWKAVREAATFRDGKFVVAGRAPEVDRAKPDGAPKPRPAAAE